MALSPKHAIRYLLANTAGVTAYTSTRVYVDNVPANVAMPYLAIERVDQEHDSHLLGRSGLARAEIQVSAFSTDAKQAEDIAEAMRIALDHYAATVTVGASNVVIKTIRINGDDDDYLPPDDGDDIGTHIRTLTFSVWHSEAVPA